MADYDYETDAARADLCRLLAACYYQPGPEFAEEKVFESMTGAAGRLGRELEANARRLAEAYSAAGQEQLLIDYTRLFLGPVQMIAKPYGSAWLEEEKELMQGSSMAAMDLYEEGGFEMDAGFHELPDHIAAELEFLYALIFRALQARQQGDADAIAAADSLRRRLLAGHLGRWVGPFTAAVREGAETPFYRELAELTWRFVSAEAGGTTTH